MVMGVQTPRVELIPAFYTNAWEEANDLAAAYGLYLDEWQQYCLRAVLGERRDLLWSASRCGMSVPRQNGKGGFLEARELFGLVILGERILHTAQELKTAKDHFRRMKGFFENDDLKKYVKKVVNTNGEEAIWLHNGGVIRFIARSKNSGRGFSADVLVCDEAQDMSDEEFAALLPTLSTSPNPQTILTGTPPGPTVNAEVYAKFRTDGIEGKDTRLVWLEWSAEPGCSIDDIDAWAQANPALGVRLNEEKISDERASLDDETFARERLGMWAGLSAHTLFDMESWSLLVSDITPSDPVAFALDVSPERDRATIGIAGYLGDAVQVEVAYTASGTGWVVNKLKDMQEKWKPVTIVIDSGSPAAALIPDLQAARIRFMQTTATDMAQACGSFYDRVQNERLLHADQPALNAAVQAATKRPIRDAFGWNRKNANADITPLVAVTLAAFGLTSKRKPRAESAGTAEAGARRVRMLR